MAIPKLKKGDLVKPKQGLERALGPVGLVTGVDERSYSGKIWCYVYWQKIQKTVPLFAREMDIIKE